MRRKKSKFPDFIAVTIIRASPVIGAPTFTQAQVLAAGALAVSSPVLGSFRVIYNVSLALASLLAPLALASASATCAQRSMVAATMSYQTIPSWL
jgi:hypothetical protein